MRRLVSQHRRGIGRVLVALLAVVALDAGAQDVKTWLDRMNRAVEQLNYEGTFVRVLDGAAETMSIVHRYSDALVVERIRSLDGPAREIIRHGGEVQCVLPDRELVLIESPSGPSSPISSALPSYTEALEQHYEFNSFTRGHVAGRETQVIIIKGRDDLRYGYVLWLDRETAMPLKFQLRDELGKLLDEILFTELQFRKSIPDEALAATLSAEGYRRVGPVRFSPQDKAGVTWRVSVLPPGFELSVARKSAIDRGGGTLEHLVYTDGLATVSVFVASSDADVVEGHSRFGSTNAYTLSLAGHKVTAMGDVPRETLQMMATSVERPRTEPL